MKPPPPPAPFSWLSALCAIAMIGLAFAFYEDHHIYDETVLSPALVHDPASWWKLVTALFVHGKEQVFPCLMALSLVWSFGSRDEKAFGPGGMLLTFVLGGAIANLVRCHVESSGWLSLEGTGGIPGGVALAGASVSAIVRSREGGLFRALLAALGSSALAVFFASTPETGVGFGENTLRYLPAVGTAFVVGGFLGAALPLRTNERARIVRALLFVVAIVATAVPGVLLARALQPAHIAAEPARPADAPATTEQDDATLGLVYDVPLYLSQRTNKAEKGQPPETAYAPTFRQFPQLFVRVIPRGEFFAADTTALQLADREREQDPTAKLVSEGPVECPLGPAHHVGLQVSHEGQEYAVWHCFVTPRTTQTMIWVRLYTELDDDTAHATLEAVVRSLKLRPDAADKEDDAHRRGRSR